MDDSIKFEYSEISDVSLLGKVKNLKLATYYYDSAQGYGSLLISSLVSIIQRNISRLGHFLPKIIVNGMEEIDENNWTVERISRPIQTAPEIKK